MATFDQSVTGPPVRGIPTIQTSRDVQECQQKQDCSIQAAGPVNDSKNWFCPEEYPTFRVSHIS
jgi:hypothetical protein